MDTGAIKIFFYLVVIAAIMALSGLVYMIFEDGYSWVDIGITALTFIGFWLLGYVIYRRIEL